MKENPITIDDFVLNTAFSLAYTSFLRLGELIYLELGKALTLTR